MHAAAYSTPQISGAPEIQGGRMSKPLTEFGTSENVAPLTLSERPPIVLDSTFSFAESMMAGIVEEQRAEHLDIGPTDSLDDDARQFEIEAFFGSGSSPLSSPCNSPSPSRSISPPPSHFPRGSPPPEAPFRSPPPQPTEMRYTGAEGPVEAFSSGQVPPPPMLQGNSQDRRNKRKGKALRREARHQMRTENPRPSKRVRPSNIGRHANDSDAIKSEYNVSDIPIASTGFVGLPGGGGRVYGLDELLKRGFTLIKNSGRGSRAIVDANGLVIAVLINRPEDLPGQPEKSKWSNVAHSAYDELMSSKDRCQFSKKTIRGRRGNFPALNAGVSFGRGQVRPGNLCHNTRNEKALRGLLSSENFIRISGFTTGAFAAWAPKLYRYYEDHFDSLLESDPRLRRNFPNTPWAAAAFNFGPRVVTARHRDSVNVPFGLCAITALGNFDPVKGGHVVLWELKLVIELPPGCTILVPSSAISHSNTPISKSETRASFTQFTSGHLFRWVDQGFQKTKDFEKTLSPEQAAEVLVQNEERCRLGLSLFSTLEELRRP